MSRILSINLGSSRPSTTTTTGETGITKQPVPTAMLRSPGPKVGGLGSGLVGDFIGDPAHHGGDHQAVYAFAREELDRWSAEIGRPLHNGEFGENLTTSGIDVDAAIVGERWQVGEDVVLEVALPRTPCRTFAAAMNIPGWVKRFTEVGRTGAYLRIIEEGSISVHDPVTVIHRPDHDITVPMTFRAVMGDLDLAQQVLTADCLPEPHVDVLRERVRARTEGNAASVD